MSSPLKTKEELTKEIENLKEVIKERNKLIDSLKKEVYSTGKVHNLSNEEISRYSRQMFIENIGVKGQEKLKSGSVLIVGCGGLGCPASQYLAGVGVGRIGLVDYDEVELSNLHRQILHSEDSLGTSKVKSIAKEVKRLNSNVSVEEHIVELNSWNAEAIISNYDVIVDATDNVATRYLLNDCCTMRQKPLVSGAAVQLEGQLTVYCYKGGPCYRCLFPQPPPPSAVANCGDVGVLPPVPGTIGVLQALQVIQILLGNEEAVLKQRMLLFDGTDTSFRTVKLRPRFDGCAVCGSKPTITSLMDYEQFCGSPANDKERSVKVLKPEDRVSVEELQEALQSSSTVLLDVRSKVEYDMCRIPGSISLPMDQLSNRELLTPYLLTPKVYVICRRGNDSQLAVEKLKKNHSGIKFLDVKGGLHSWAKHIDLTFPVY